MRVLLVEDEIHKRDEIYKCVIDVYNSPPEIVDGVSSAVLSVMKSDYDLIILDMALSTFGESSDDNKKGHDQVQGGIEVLRALKSTKKSTKIIIVTQYPDFYIGGTRVKLKDSPKIINERYNQSVIGAVLYHYKSVSTLQKIVSILRGIQ
ncbi:response regulator [Aeromonas sp. MR19]|uniref:response regulator n=1 Tax=Aeromonas sp. MR19 TaxID=2923421 RepID=UPI001F4AF2AC|nr:response regulator [Aeromonas sp. MR19]MCH7374460.1 response regulator [Aeromonas sp. MR19]